MTLHDFIVIIAALINLLALGGFAWWIVGWIRALNGTVDAQQRTIDAFKTLLDATDTPKMLERMEAYKKFVDNEKEAFQQDLKRTSAEESEKILKEATRDASTMIDIIADFMPYVPTEKRKKMIEPANVHPILKGRMQRLVEEAPDLPKSNTRIFLSGNWENVLGAPEQVMRYSEILALLEEKKKE